MKNQLGIHALVWVTDWTETSIPQAINATAEVGYDLIEVVIFDPASAHPELTAKTLTEAGLGCVTGMALNPMADISSHDGDIARRGEQLIADAISATRDMGSKLLGGVTHSAMHRYLNAPFSGAMEQVAEVYGRLAEKAQSAGIRLGIEAVNRYESNIVNTLDKAAQILDVVNNDALFIHADTYHMNIEEADPADAIRRNVSRIGHVHIGESHRGYLGSGSVNFPEVFRALAYASYEGPIVFEAFSPAVLNTDLSDALAAWRHHWQSPQALAEHSLSYMKTQLIAAEKALALRHPAAKRTER